MSKQSEQPAPYTAEELIDILKSRQGTLTQVQFAQEIGISHQLLSQVYRRDRSVGSDAILKYLAPPGSKFVHGDIWILIKE